MSDVTRILSQVERGDPQAADQLLPLVYDELRKLAAARLAQEKPGQTLQATALVHEAYLRLVTPKAATSGRGPQEAAEHLDTLDDPHSPTADLRPATSGRWDSRAHFFAAAAEAMRRILVQKARYKARVKHGGNLQRCELDAVEIIAPATPEEALALDEALARLESVDRSAAELVKLRYFAGMTIPEAADALAISPRKANQLWAYARAWLLAELRLTLHE